jgi:hypothetical protein
VANRYWVGGTASWDGTAGTKWALTDGGAGGQAVPTSADDVFFDGASGAVTCTIASGNTGAKSINCTGFTGTIAGSTAITVSGSVTLVAGMTYTHTGIITITGTGTLTTAGKTFSGVTVSGVGITVTLGDSLDTGTRTVNVTQGTFDTQNFNLNAGTLFSSNSNTRTINLGSSTLNLSSASNALDFTTSTNLTFNAGTSQINLTAGSGNAIFAGGGRTFYNVLFASGFTTISVQGQNTFNNLTVAGFGSAGVTQVTFDSRQIINGTLSTTGTAGNRRVWFRGATYGIAHTLTINSAPSLTDADFRDLYVIGTAAPISGTRIGDLRGCRGITFDTPKTVYWNSAAGGTWSATNWAATSGASTSNDNFPLAQDTAVIENTGLNTSATVTLNATLPFIGTLDMSTRTNAATISISSGNVLYGNLVTGSGITYSGAQAVTFSGRNTQTINSAGKTFSGGITVDSYGGTVELADALNIGSRELIITNGTFDTKNYNLTAGTLASNNSNVRTINLGSSTLILSLASEAINFITSTNLIFNAGTSQITCSGDSGGSIFSGGGQTFNNVSLTSTNNASTPLISGANTFANLTISAPSSTGFIQIRWNANNIITGTLTCSGASPIRRIFVRSDTLGTQRDLTVGTLAATDCDFRDIEILGAAAGSTPTRAGDCGGNTGITFPAAKTVYWNLAGAQNWSATGWAPGSGGSPDINNFPLAQDTAVFDEAAGSVTGTITINAAWNIGTFDASLRTSAMTLTTSTNAPVVYGDWKFGTGVTSSSTTGIVTFSGRGTQTITSNGVSFGCPVTINCVTGTVQLADALVIDSARTLTLTSGTFDAVTYNVTTGLFTSSAVTATLKMGSGTWTLSGTGLVWQMATTLLTLYKGTADIVLSNTSTTARTFAGNGYSYNKLTIGGATGISTLTITGNNQFTELASTKTVAHTIALGTTTQTFGAWTVSGTAGNVVTLTGTGTGHILAGACTSGIDYLAMGSIGFAATSPGEFYAGANSTGTAAAPVYRTAKPADSTRYWVGGTGNWSDTARWSDSSGGGSGASVPRSHDDVVFDSLSNATAYTATVNAVTGGIRTKALTIAGPLVGNLTLAGSTAINGIHGNVSLAATGVTRTYTGAITVSGSTTGKTINTNGVILGSTFEINGVGSEWGLGGAINSNLFRFINGTFSTNNYNLTTQGIASNYQNSRTINLGSSTISISGFNQPLIFGTTENERAALSFSAGTSEISIGANSLTFSGNNQTFYNVSFTGTSSSSSTFNGANTFNNLSVTGITAAGLKVIAFTANQTINGTLTLSAGTNATMRTFLQSDTIGTTRTLTCAAVSATDTDFRDITIAGAAAPASGTRLGDCKGNSGITFDAAKTVYWNLAGNNNWSATGWAASSGASPAVNNFPLAQDTAVFEATSPGTGATTTINAAWNIGTIDMSARTTNTMTLATSSNAPAIYGNWINGTGTTLTGTGTLTFAGRGSQTITSAGRTFTQDFTIATPSGSVTLQDAFATNRTLTLSTGTFDAAGYNATLGLGLSAAGTNVRTLAIGSGTWTSTGTGTSAWASQTSTNLTVTGTGTISLTSASAKTFEGGGVSYSGITLNQGGAGTLTITGNNTFANITNTYKATGATTIALGTTTQRVGAFGASGEAGRVLTVTGTSATSPATLVFTGSGQATTPTTDYLTITGVRAYSLDTTWYAGNNSTNNGSLGWYFVAGGGGAVTAFIIESSIAADSISGFAAFNTNASETTTAADSISSLALFGIGISETITASEAQAAGLICLGTLSETATAADVAAAFQAYVAAVSEATTATDLIAASLTLNAAISELTTGSEQFAASFAFSASVSELVTAADSLSGGLLFLSSISEATTAEEVVSATVIFNRAIAEAATVSDVLVAIATLNAAVPELVSGSDVAQALLTVGGSVNEALAALDASAALLTMSPEIAETASAQEVAANVYTANPSIAEAAQSVDSLAVAPSTFGAVALAVAQAIESLSPAGSVYNAALPVESAGITDFLVGSYLWNPIDDTQAANWQNISSGQNPAWTQVLDAQSPGWQDLNNAQTPNWGQVPDGQAPAWVVVPTTRD